MQYKITAPGDWLEEMLYHEAEGEAYGSIEVNSLSDLENLQNKYSCPILINFKAQEIIVVNDYLC